MKFLMQYAGRKAAYILALLGLCLTLIGGQNNFWGYEKPMNASNCPHLKIWTIAKLEWNNPIDLEVITLGPLPPDVAQITGRPGPKYYPVRPYIEETFANPAGLASMVALGTRQTMPGIQCLEPDGQKRFVALLLSQNPKGELLAFSDKWLLTGDRVGGALSYYNRHLP